MKERKTERKKERQKQRKKERMHEYSCADCVCVCVCVCVILKRPVCTTESTGLVTSKDVVK
jgi:hypothetical protein